MSSRLTATVIACSQIGDQRNSTEFPSAKDDFVDTVRQIVDTSLSGELLQLTRPTSRSILRPLFAAFAASSSCT